MSWTLKVSNGDYDFEVSTGKVPKVTDFEKASQDLAEVQLSNFDADRNYGNELLDMDLTPSYAIAAGEVTRTVSEAFSRLQAMQSSQRNLSVGEKLSHIEQLTVVPTGDGSMIYYMDARLTNGQSITAAMQAGKAPQMTKLGHLLPAGLVGQKLLDVVP